MQRIDIKKVCDNIGMSYNDLAKALFPSNKFPKPAMDRIASGESPLDEDQIRKLALLLDVNIADLFNHSWKSPIFENDTHTLINGGYRAELNTKNWTSKIFYKESLFSETILHDKFIALSKYLAMLNTQIVNHKARKVVKEWKEKRNKN